MINAKQDKMDIGKKRVLENIVAPKGIEPLPQVPETYVLSIKLRSQRVAKIALIPTSTKTGYFNYKIG